MGFLGSLAQKAGFDYIPEEERQNRQKRADNATNLAKDLIDKGLNSDEVNQTVNDWINTGQIKIPSKQVPNGPPVPTEGPPTASGQGPAPYQATMPVPNDFHKTLKTATQDKGTGAITNGPEIPFGQEDPQPKIEQFGNAEDELTQHYIWVYGPDGKLVRKDKTNGKVDQVMHLPYQPTGPGSATDQLRKATVLKGQEDYSKGKMDPAENEYVADAAEGLGIPTKEVPGRTPGIVDKTRQFISDKTDGLVSPPSGLKPYKMPDLSGGPGTPSGLVSVVHPDGRTGKIPKKNLKAALAAGYKLPPSKK